MCGICGYVATMQQLNEGELLLERMNGALRHRGPDDAGANSSNRAMIAMRRLSIIDVGGGQQPIPNEDESCWIVFNGEIYNYRDLSDKLHRAGHTFRTRSDTETILHLYEERGTDSVHALQGMFAFAISDERNHHLFLARDRVGKKPLYYYHSDDVFVFGSEIKALLQHPDVPKRVNSPVLPLYLQFGYLPEPYTMFEGVRKVPAGCWLMLDYRTWKVEIRQYWDFPFATATRAEMLDETEAVAAIREGIHDAVERRLESEVPLGAFLSAGLDSAAIVAEMARLKQNVHTFTVGYDLHQSYDERAGARALARHFKTLHTEFTVRPDVARLLPTLVWHYDEPFFDSSAVPTYLVAKMARQHVTVVLNGDGGDELLGGYQRFLTARLSSWYRKLVPNWGHRGAKGLVGLVPEGANYGNKIQRLRRFLNYAEQPLAQQFTGMASLYDSKLLDQLLGTSGASAAGDTLFAALFEEVREQSALTQMLYVHCRTALIGDLLIKADRMSMAASLEARSPLLDQELFALAARIPDHLKIRGTTTKFILRRALSGVVPDEVLQRSKHGFNLPVASWFRAELRPMLENKLLRNDALIGQYLDSGTIRRLVTEHTSGQRNRGDQLWGLLTLEWWLELLGDGSLLASAPPTAPDLQFDEVTTQF